MTINVAVIYYSATGAVHRVAGAVAEGARLATPTTPGAAASVAR